MLLGTRSTADWGISASVRIRRKLDIEADLKLRAVVSKAPTTVMFSRLNLPS